VEVGEKIRLVSFMDYDLGFFDHELDSIFRLARPAGVREPRK